MFSRLFVYSFVVCVASAATAIGYLPMKPKEFANKTGCYIKEINDVIPFGTDVTPKGVCYIIHCSPGMLDYASCGVVGTSDDNCHVTEGDLTKPYPDCCPDIECDDVDNNII